MEEIEPRKFKRGESTGRPLGGNVSDEAFPQALYSLALARGYESQLSLARALGKKRNNIVSIWYRGNGVPSPEEFGRLLILFQPNDEELDRIVEPYGRLLEEGKGNRGPIKASEMATKLGQIHIKEKLTPFDSWLEQFCKKRVTPMITLAEYLGCSLNGIRTTPSQPYLGLVAYSEILQKIPQALNLDEDETGLLAESVAQTIERAFEEGHSFQPGLCGASVKKLQREVVCRTYTGVQAAGELGISRQRVGQLRGKFNLPYLLTEDDINLLRPGREVWKNRKASG